MTDRLQFAYDQAVDNINKFIGEGSQSRWMFLKETSNFLGNDITKFMSRELRLRVEKTGLPKKYEDKKCTAFTKKTISHGVGELIFSPNERLTRLDILGELTIAEVDNDIEPLLNDIVSTLRSSDK